MPSQPTREGRRELRPHLPEIRQRGDPAGVKDSRQGSDAARSGRGLPNHPLLDQALDLLGQRTPLATGHFLQAPPRDPWQPDRDDRVLHVFECIRFESLRQDAPFEKAIAVDPKFAAAYAFLSYIHATEVCLGLSSSPGQSLERAFELAQQAIALNDSLADAHSALAFVYLLRRRHTEAIAAGERAVALNPGGADVTATLAATLQYSGRPEESFGLMKNAMRLSPVYPSWYLSVLGRGYVMTGRYEEALVASDRWRDLTPDSPWPYWMMALADAGLNREVEARAAMAHFLRLEPRMTLERWAKLAPYKNPADLERVLDLARKAGLK